MSPTILVLATDLFFIPTIRQAASSLGYEVRAISEYRPVTDFLLDLQEAPPALVILDLNSSLPWPEWLPAAKAQASELPWLAFGSHMNPRRLATARHTGADKVVPKSQFTAELKALIAALAVK